MNIKQRAITNKLLKAKTILLETEVLMQYKFYATVINRLYYACFHATKALLLSKDIVPKTHSGVIAALHQHFVQAGSFNMAEASFYSKLMQERMNDDYSDEINIEEKDAREFVESSKKYIAYVELQIKALIIS